MASSIQTFWDCQKRYADCGLTRFSHGHVFTMGALAPEDAASAVVMFLEHFRVSASAGASAWWSEQLARRSDSWPQHLHTAMQELAKELIVVGGRLDDVDREAAFEHGRLLRRESCLARVSPVMDDSKYLVGDLMAGMPVEGRDRLAIIEELENRDREMRGRPGRCLPEGMTATGFLDHLVHQGVLQQKDDRRLGCPIPSFRK